MNNHTQVQTKISVFIDDVMYTTYTTAVLILDPYFSVVVVS